MIGKEENWRDEEEEEVAARVSVDGGWEDEEKEVEPREGVKVDDACGISNFKHAALYRTRGLVI